MSEPLEKHFTPQQVAEMWEMSPEKVREIFAEEQGVIRIGHNGLLGTRKRVSLRIPLSMLTRVYNERLTTPLPKVERSRGGVKKRLPAGDEGRVTPFGGPDGFMAKEGL